MPKHDKNPFHSTIVTVVLQVLLSTIFIVFAARLIYLQVYQYDVYSPISDRNSVRQQIINPARGLIYDRDGNLLVGNEPSFTINITPLNFDDRQLPLLAELVDMPQAELLQLIEQANEYSLHRETRLLRDVDFKTFSNIQENLWQLPGISHQVEGKRSYPTQARLAHAFGYLSEVTRPEMQRSEFYRLGDAVGRSGLEQVYEEQLRGEKGMDFITVNAFGRSIRSFNEGKLNVNPRQGGNIHTTIDTELQRVTEELMEGKIGGAVAINPKTGGILAISSAPDYDVSRLAGQLDREYWQAVNADSLTPLFNRSIATAQPPGSTIKPMMGLIGMRLGMIDKDTKVMCRGGYQRGRLYRCLDSHGNIGIEEAIEKSCNTFFYAKMDEMMGAYGLTVWTEMMREFGLGMRNNIDLTNEIRGLVPDSTYFDRVYGERKWGIGDLINLGIGQGAMGASPLQLAVAAATLANGGARPQPHLVNRISYQQGVDDVFEPRLTPLDWITEDMMAPIQEGMRRAVTEGSGRYYANLADVEVAGKTGTAENSHGQNHGWFIAYAPYDDPEIAIAVLMQNAGYGSITAAPVTAMMMEQYFHGEIRRQWIYDRMLEFEPEPYDPETQD